MSSSHGWRGQALCAQTDPELWFPEIGMGNMSKQAKRICAMCDVTEPCLNEALADPSLIGIWGGTSERDRYALRRQMNKVSA